jgi:polar amino acid transport system permease protein
MIGWFHLFINSLPEFMRGMGVTLELTVVGLAMGLILGLAAAMSRVYGGKVLKAVAVGYIELFRGTPLLVQLFLIYYGLPSLGTALHLPLTLSRLASAFLALGLNSGAYQAEYLRGAIQSIGAGQMMAGRAIGLSRIKTVWYVIMPQALRLVIPSWSNEPIALLKTTAIVYLIAVPDLMTRAKDIVNRTYDPIGTYLAVAIVYLAMVFVLDYGLKFLERRSRIPGFEMDANKGSSA